MNFLSRSEINATYTCYLKPYIQSGNLPYLSVTDNARLLSLDEVAFLFGFEPFDLAGFILVHSEAHPGSIPYQLCGEDIVFEREAILSWYLETALPLLKEASC
ncbi:MAG: hypothetical protein JEY71_18005 [Sphaerochaeta sp.]|nr:hypothetical protein [Sphaerochaeta sp.]